MEERKLREKEYHNLKRDEVTADSAHSAYVTSQRKWYSIVRKSRNCSDAWLQENCRGKKVLDYGCGNGLTSVSLAKMGAESVVGIDISDLSLENAKRLAEREKCSTITSFMEMDAENMNFPSNSFDIVQENGVLHHLDLDKAYADLARVLKPAGKMICTEALGHNVLIQRYRRRTPHLRTEWEVEHILHKKDIELAKKYFNTVKILGFFHLASIAAVPFRNSIAFSGILRSLETVDSLLLKIPGIRWQAWQVVFVLSNPKK